jgi:hypothetical protein
VESSVRSGRSFAILVAVLAVAGGIFTLTEHFRSRASAKEKVDSKTDVPATSGGFLPEGEPDAAVESPKRDVHFYLDASQSMSSFLSRPGYGQKKSKSGDDEKKTKPGSDRKNYFNLLLLRGGNIISASGSPATISFWRFGSGEPREIAPEELEKFGENPSSFSDQSTHIERAILHSKHGKGEPDSGAPQTKIIVTDLLQDLGHSGDLAKLLDESYISTNQAVGVLAVRNPHQGDVELVPGKPADSLPFYFLITGPVADVRFAIRLLVHNLPIDSKDHFEMIFARRLGDQLVGRLEVNKNGDKNKKFTPITLDEDLVPGATQRKILTLASVRRNLNLDLTLTPTSADPYPHISLESRNQVSWKKFKVKAASGWEVPSQDAVSVSGDGAELQMHIDHSKLEKGTIYLIRIEQLGKWGEVGKLSDLEPWNLESVADVTDDGFPLDAFKNRMGKTLNLSHFLTVIALNAFHEEVPLARYYLYIQAK